MALYSLTNRQAETKLDDVGGQVEAAQEAGEITAKEAGWLQQIVDDARAGNWKEANQASRTMMQEQVQLRPGELPHLLYVAFPAFILWICGCLLERHCRALTLRGGDSHFAEVTGATIHRTKPLDRATRPARAIATTISMPRRNHHAAPYRRTRRDHETETAEDYVEAAAEIVAEKGKCRVVDLARRFAVSHVTVTKIVARLKEAGLMTSEPYGPIELTERGRRMAKESKERHDVVYAFLRSLGVSEEVAAADAEGMEHHVSKETLRRFREFLTCQRL